MEKRMMKADLAPKACASLPLNQILGSAVVLNWDALTAGATAGLVRIEYHVGADGALESLKLWARAREYWSLICDYPVHLGWSDGPRFQNGYHSRRLGRLLQSIVMNQNMFTHECSANTNGLLEIGTPTMEDTASATERVNEAFHVQP
jgi:hypothetical protein